MLERSWRNRKIESRIVSKKHTWRVGLVQVKLLVTQVVSFRALTMFVQLCCLQNESGEKLVERILFGGREKDLRGGDREV